MHCQNWGWTLKLQHHQYCKFGIGAGLVLKSFVNFIITILINITAGRTCFKYRQLRQCKPLCETSKDTFSSEYVFKTNVFYYNRSMLHLYVSADKQLMELKWHYWMEYQAFYNVFYSVMVPVNFCYLSLPKEKINTGIELFLLDTCYAKLCSNIFHQLSFHSKHRRILHAFWKSG